MANDLLGLLEGKLGWTPRFEPRLRQEQSSQASGRTYVKDFGDPLWTMRVGTKQFAPNELDYWRALLNRQMGGLGTIIGYPLSRVYPIAHPNGNWAVGAFTGSNAYVTAWGTDNQSVTIGGLAAGLVLSVGDYIQIDADYLHQVTTGGTASGGGALTVTVTPPFWPGEAIGVPPVSLVRPHCIMSIDPGSITTEADLSGRASIGFTATEVRGIEYDVAMFDAAGDSVLVRNSADQTDYLDDTPAAALTSGLLVLVRAGATATYIGPSGTILTAAANTLRRTYDPLTLLPLGWLLEPARTNLALWASDFTNAAWTKSNLTAAKTATGPDGVANSASTLTATAANGTALQAITSGSAKRVTDCYIKRRTGTGVVNITHDNGTTWTPVTVTAGWTQAQNPATTAANPTVGIRIVTSGDAVDVAYFQHEVGPLASSPILTTTVAVARAADVLYADLTKLGFDATQYTVLGTVYPNGDVVTQNSVIFDLYQDANNRVYLRNNTAGNNTLQFVGIAASVTTLGIADAVVRAAEAQHFAAAVAANNAELVRNSVSIGIDSSGALPAAPTKLYIGGPGPAGSIGEQWGGVLRDISIRTTRMSQADMRIATVG